MAGAALAVAAVLGVGGVARWALSGDGDRDTAPAATPATSPAVTPSAAPTIASPAPRPSTAAPRPSSAATTKPPASTPPGHTQVEQGPLWSDGSVRAGGDNAARSEITLKLGEPVTALTITVRVKRTRGFSDQGAVHDVTTARIDSQVIQEPDVLTYRFTLAAGATLGTGTHVFAAKYGHGGGRSAGDDTYRATATTADGEKLTVHGDFH
ncbi:hypothetical protein [Couchioplanes caeruleus]|uniref:Uncharacterized protein n=2 Tax=Couchioplanes caeruleus TaxID=56438 RepID=A0A1K0G7L8_9ACTN|nr:hypothetical protein [Couchioplanes caeruleus]OJF13242.1 hypothetical protein BG844_16330 [Couchioplanes caeruleus subsp. caeruleus]